MVEAGTSGAACQHLRFRRPRLAAGIYLVAIVLLAFSFFPLTGRRVQLFGILLCILLAVALALLLQSNRPFFAIYAPTIIITLLLIRTWIYGRDQEGIAWDQQVEFSVQHSLILNAFRWVAHGYIQPQSVTQLSYYRFPYFTDQLLPALLLTLVVMAALQLRDTYRTSPASG